MATLIPEARNIRGSQKLEVTNTTTKSNPLNCETFSTLIVMQEASDAHSKTADSDTVSTYQVSSVQLVTDKKLEAFNKA